MTKISGIATTETTMASVQYLEGERADGTSVKIPSGLIGLVGVQVITATGAGTYTPTAGTKSIIIEMCGGGGGGGACAQPTGSNVAMGAGGGGAAYLRKRLTADFSGAAYSVGVGGTGGAAGANAGTDGGDTTFTDTAATVYTAGKGSGGSAGTAGIALRLSPRGSGGSATNGDVSINGTTAIPGPSLSTSSVLGGSGGVSFLGRIGTPGLVNVVNSSSAGGAASGYGAGGGGAAAAGTGAAVAGGNGAPGILIIYEYSN